MLYPGTIVVKPNNTGSKKEKVLYRYTALMFATVPVCAPVSPVCVPVDLT